MAIIFKRIDNAKIKDYLIPLKIEITRLAGILHSENYTANNSHHSLNFSTIK